MSQSLLSILRPGRLRLKRLPDGLLLRRTRGRMGKGLVVPLADREHPWSYPGLVCALRYWQHRRSQWSSFEHVFSGVFSVKLVVQLADREPLTVGYRFPGGERGARFVGYEERSLFAQAERIGAAVLKGAIVRKGESWGDPDGEKVGEVLDADGLEVTLKRHHAHLRGDDGEVWLEAADLCEPRSSG